MARRLACARKSGAEERTDRQMHVARVASIKTKLNWRR